MNQLLLIPMSFYLFACQTGESTATLSDYEFCVAQYAPFIEAARNPSLEDPTQQLLDDPEIAVEDFDSDTIIAIQEITEFGTDPCLADTDGDGLNDKAEVDSGLDPLNPDEDGDGHLDGLDHLYPDPR